MRGGCYLGVSDRPSGPPVPATRGRGLVEITGAVCGWTRSAGVGDGLLTLFVRHTSASLLVQENADPGVHADLERFFARLVPDGDPLFEHTAEGPDDMPAHVRAALTQTQTQLSIPVLGGRPALGTWQGVFLYEHRLYEYRRAAQRRQVVLHLIGDDTAAVARLRSRCEWPTGPARTTRSPSPRQNRKGNNESSLSPSQRCGRRSVPTPSYLRTYPPLRQACIRPRRVA